MMKSLMKSIFGSSNERYVASMQKLVSQVNALEDQIEALSDEELSGVGGGNGDGAATGAQQGMGFTAMAFRRPAPSRWRRWIAAGGPWV